MKNIISKEKRHYFDRIPRIKYPDDELYPHGCYSLADLLAFVKSKGWTDFDHITIGSNTHHRSNETFVWIEAHVPKSEKEIKIEEEKYQLEAKEREKESLIRKQKREAKKLAKEKVLSKLSPEEKKLLRL